MIHANEPRKQSFVALFPNGVLYVVKAYCQWRQLPHDFLPYTTVWNFYRRTRTKGLWDKILAGVKRQVTPCLILEV